MPGIIAGQGGGKLLSAVDEMPVIYTDEALGLDYTEPVLGVTNLNARVGMTLNVDVDSRDKTPSGDPTHKWAARLYSDAALRSEISTWTTQVNNRLRIWGSEAESARWYDVETGLESTIELKASGKDWGLHNDYYLVRYVDADGVKLERPVVTRFNFQAKLSAPTVTAGESVERPGDLALNWSPVEGAEQYVVVYGRSPEALGGNFDNTADILGLSYTYMGETSDTSWSISESFYAQSNEEINWRNRGLTHPELNEDDSNNLDVGEFVATDLRGDVIGVLAIASDGTRSPLGTVNAAGILNSLPTKVARYAYEAAEISSRAAAGADEIDVPKFVPYVDFTGRIQSSPVSLVDPTLIAGTMRATIVSEYGFIIPYEKKLGDVSQDRFADEVDKFNREAADLAGNPGELRVVADAVIAAGTPQLEYEDTGLPAPTAASHPMVEYIAGHMLAGTEVIDLSEWADQPGAPEPRHATMEAAMQTPLAFVGRLNVSNGAAYVTYEYPAEERSALQQEVYQSALVAIDGMGLESMSDAQKITAFNDYLSDTVVYDYAAYGQYPSTDGHLEAYNLVGVMTEGTGVCAGYTHAMNLFAQIEGIESVYVSGKVANGGRHAWNKFKIDGEWFAVDATWNDGDVPDHDYLLISDSEFVGNAERTEESDSWVIPSYTEMYATS